MAALSVKKIAKLKEPGRYGDGHGLYLQVVSETNRSWLFRYERDGKERMLGLGPLHTFSLEEARQSALNIRQQLKAGIDPMAEREAEKARRAMEAARRKTFEECATAYFNAHERKWTNAKARAQFLSTLRTYAFPVLGRLPVAEIDAGLILRVLEPIWSTKTKTARMLRQRIEVVLNWAAAHGYRTGDNPARWSGGALQHLLPKAESVTRVEHHPALPYREAPAFMAQLRALQGIPARALEFTILTAARAGEVRGATWDEVDLEARVWTIPAARMKGGKEHRVPLSPRAVELLESSLRIVGCEFIFPGARGGPMHKDAMWKALKARADLTVHGFRSTFRDWAAETTGYDNHVVEMALAHTIGSAVEAAYRRGDLFEKRTRLMADWSRFCCSDPSVATGEVVPLRSAR